MQFINPMVLIIMTAFLEVFFYRHRIFRVARVISLLIIKIGGIVAVLEMMLLLYHQYAGMMRIAWRKVKIDMTVVINFPGQCIRQGGLAAARRAYDGPLLMFMNLQRNRMQ